MTLEVLISTLGSRGMANVAKMQLPKLNGVSYLVSWQCEEDDKIPSELTERTDVRILPHRSRGLSRNRNFALDHASGDILLIADDDLRYTPEGLRKIIAVFEENRQLELATFRYDAENAKSYPAHECSLNGKLPKGYYVTSFEIALRRESPAGALRFPVEFGVGSPLFGAGEEEIVILMARKRGITCRFFPVTICRHEGLTTGSRRVTSPAVYRGFGAVIGYLYPATCLPRILLKALRGSRNGTMSFFPAIYHMTAGLLRAITQVKIQWREESAH